MAASVRDVQPPPTLSETIGRDGSPTFCWSEDGGRLVWLGRTTMPQVRSAALLEAFQPGTRNVLLYGFGQGAEVHALLRRLAPHQAVFVIEETAWIAGLVLRLYDFAEDLRLGRLVILAGPDAWQQLEDFLRIHHGFLTPERVLAWPWFDPADVAAVSDRLSAIAGTIARYRSERHAELRRRRAAGASPPADMPAQKQACHPTVASSAHAAAQTLLTGAPVLALLSNVPEARIRNTAASIRAAAESLGWTTAGFVLADPAYVHPHAVESALWKAGPSLLILLDTLPGAVPIDLPPAPKCVLCAHRLPLAAEWLRQLQPDAVLGVMTRRQSDEALAAGLDSSRIMVLPLAAQVGLDKSPSQDSDKTTAGGMAVALDGHAFPDGMAAQGRGHATGRILVVAEGHDPSAEAVGLHLASHCNLWEAAARVIRERCDAYCDDDADAVLGEAQRRLRIKLDSPEVRQGLVTRIRRVLGPVLVRQACCLALVEAGVEFELYGGWEHDEVLSRYHRGLWPSPGAIAAALSGGSVIVSIEPSGVVHSALLDGLAAGLAGVVRAHSSDDTSDGLAGVLDPREHVWRFARRAELVQLLRRFQARPDEFRPRAAAAARHINDHHTWACRLHALAKGCGVLLAE